MWPYSDEESDWCSRFERYSLRNEIPVSADIEAAMARARDLRAQAVGQGLAWLMAAALRLLRRFVQGPATRDATDDDVLTVLADNLRTPLNSIRASAEALRDNPDLSPDQRQHFLQIVIAEDQRLALLLERILGASHVAPRGRRWQVALSAIEPIGDRRAA